MKALSLKQPYAELVVSGRKTIELRKWNTKFRGEFLVHASKQVDNIAMKKFGFTNLPLGCIVGKAILTEVKHYENESEHMKDNDKHLASSVWGNYGFIITNAKKLRATVPCKGSLNFWEFKGKY